MCRCRSTRKRPRESASGRPVATLQGRDASAQTQAQAARLATPPARGPACAPAGWVSVPATPAGASPRTRWRPRGRPRRRTRGRRSRSAPPTSQRRPVALLLQDALGGGQRQGRVDRDLARQAQGHLHRGTGLGQAVDQAQLGGALSEDRLAGERQLHRHVVGQRARQAQQRAAGGHERALDLGDAELARHGRRRSGRTPSATSRPPATAKPSIAAISGLTDARRTMPAKPRSPTQGRSPVTNAFRSMPAQKPLPAPVSTPTLSPSSPSSSIERRGDALGQRQVDGVARVGAVERDQQHALASLGQDDVMLTTRHYAANRRSSGSRLPRRTSTSTSTQSMSSRRGEHARLRLDPLRDQHAPTRGHRGVQADALQVARQLAHRIHRGDALDLNRHPLISGVATHQVDRTDVGWELAAHQPKALATPMRGVGKQFLQFALEPFLLERCKHVQLVIDVGEHLGDRDLQTLVGALLAHKETHQRAAVVALLSEHRGRRHPVERLDVGRAAVGPHHERAIPLAHQQTHGLRQHGGGAADIGDLTASDDQTHRRTVSAEPDYSSSLCASTLIASRNSRMPLPSARATSGSRLGPSTIRAMAPMNSRWTGLSIPTTHQASACPTTRDDLEGLFYG